MEADHRGHCRHDDRRQLVGGVSIKKLGGKPDDYGYFVFPTDTDRLAYFATSIYRSSNSKNKAGAAKLVDYLTQKASRSRSIPAS